MAKGSVALKYSRVGQGLPKIAGQVLQPKHLKAFELYTQYYSLEEVAQVMKISVRTLYQWRNQGWWKELHQTYIEDKQQDFYLQMCAKADEIITGYFEVVTGRDKGDKTANARVQAAKLFMESGSNPLIKKHAATFNIQNTQVTQTNRINIQQLKEMTQAELLEMNLTGIIPEKVLNHH